MLSAKCLMKKMESLNVFMNPVVEEFGKCVDNYMKVYTNGDKFFAVVLTIQSGSPEVVAITRTVEDKATACEDGQMFLDMFDRDNSGEMFETCLL